MDPDVTPEPETAKASLKNFVTSLKNLVTPLRNLLTPLKSLPAALKNLPIPKKLVIPAIAGAVLFIAGGAVFGLLHARFKHAVGPQVKAVASAPLASTAGHSAACGGVVRDLYRQTVDEDPGVTLAEVRSEVLSSGVSCAPVPAIAAELKDLSPACRDMVQYTFLGVRDGHPDIKVHDVRQKIVQKSVACEHDRTANIASAARHKER